MLMGIVAIGKAFLKPRIIYLYQVIMNFFIELLNIIFVEKKRLQ